MERDYSMKMIRKQILRAQEYSRLDFLERKNSQLAEQKLTFNITYYPAFQNVRGITEELQILLIPNKEHMKVFPIALVITFWNRQTLKD